MDGEGIIDDPPVFRYNVRMSEWPEVVYEDTLDADLVEPAFEFPTAPIKLWPTSSMAVYMDGELIGHTGTMEFGFSEGENGAT